MGTRRDLRRAGSLCALAALVTAVSCLDPTEVTLVITTDVPCPQDNGTSISVGTASEIASNPVLTVTKDCTSVSSRVNDAGALTTPASVGTLVVTPSGSRTDSFAVRVVMAIDATASPVDCTQAMTGCIVATREVSFIPHTAITLPIELTLDCEGVGCPPGHTCDHGRCVAELAVSMCSGGLCTAIVQADASSPAGATSAADSSPAPDAKTDGPALDATVADAGDSTTPTMASEAGGESDASPLGTCLEAGLPRGVACAGSVCAANEVCCITAPVGAPPMEQCTLLADCNYNAANTAPVTALGCRNAGDCPSGSFCCAPPGTGSGYASACATSCVTTVTSKQYCRNSCECTGTYNVCNAKLCLGAIVGVCGLAGGSSCP
jgi:hypothetical protein